MFCSYCGTQNKDGANFCRGCGKPIKMVAPAQVQSMPEQTQPVQSALEQEQSAPAQAQPAQSALEQEQSAPAQPVESTSAQDTQPVLTPKQQTASQAAAPVQPQKTSPQSAPAQPVAKQQQPAPTPVQPTPNQQAEPAQTKAPKKKGKAGLIIGIVAALIILLGGGAAVFFLFFFTPTINLDDYIITETEGYNGIGEASVSVDWDAIEDKYGKLVRFTSEGKKQHDDTDAASYLEDYITVDIEGDNGIYANGDTVNYAWTIDEDFVDIFRCGIKCADGSFTAEGLKEVDTFDAFADTTINFAGIAPQGELVFSYNGTDMTQDQFTIDKTDNLSNGDVITITIDKSVVSDLAKKSKKVPQETSKQITVEGLSTHITTMVNYTDENLQLLKDKAEAAFNKQVNYWVSDESQLQSLNYIGNYLLVNKNNSDSIELYLVYSFTARNHYKTYDQTTTGYWFAKYTDVLEGPDGKLITGQSYPNEPNAYFNVDSGISEWWSTHQWRYVGYEDLDTLYYNVVTNKMDNYYHEDNVDASLAADAASNAANLDGDEAALTEDGTGLTTTGYIIADSDTRLVTEEDLDGLTPDECKIARNEIYARHGRKFKDEALQAHFDACDWYEGTIDPDDFKDTMLSDIENKNKDFISKYEEQHGYR